MTKDLEYPGCGQQHAPCFEALTRRNTPVYSLHLLNPHTHTQTHKCPAYVSGMACSTKHTCVTNPPTESTPIHPAKGRRATTRGTPGHLSNTIGTLLHISSLQICNAKDSAVPNSFIIIVEESKSQDTCCPTF